MVGGICDLISVGCWTAEFPGLRGSEPETATSGRDHCGCLPWLHPAWRVTAASLMFSTDWTFMSTPPVHPSTWWSPSPSCWAPSPCRRPSPASPPPTTLSLEGDLPSRLPRSSSSKKNISEPIQLSPKTKLPCYWAQCMQNTFYLLWVVG